MKMNRLLALLLAALLMLTCNALAEEFTAPVSAAFDGVGAGEISESVSGENAISAQLAALIEEKAFAPLQVAGATVDKTTAQTGETITWTAFATGGNYDYAYFFNLFCGDEVVKYGEWQLSNTFSWTPTKPGNYYVAAYAVDSRWTEIAGPASEGGLVPVTQAQAPVIPPLKASLSVDKTTAKVGETLTWTLTPSGGNGDYAYFYNLFCGDEVVMYGNWQLDPSISWTPTKPGNYYAAGYVVDSRWVEISQAPEGGLVPVAKADPLAISDVTAGNHYPYLGNTVTYKPVVTGGVKPYSGSVKVTRMNSSGSWMHYYSGDLTNDLKLDLRYQLAGDYKLAFTVKDAAGATAEYTKEVTCQALNTTAILTNETQLPALIVTPHTNRNTQSYIHSISATTNSYNADYNLCTLSFTVTIEKTTWARETVESCAFIVEVYKDGVYVDYTPIFTPKLTLHTPTTFTYDSPTIVLAPGNYTYRITDYDDVMP